MSARNRPCKNWGPLLYIDNILINHEIVWSTQEAVVNCGTLNKQANIVRSTSKNKNLMLVRGSPGK